MYRFGERPHNHHKLWLTLIGFVVIACLAVFAVLHLLKADTNIGQTPPPLTTTVTSNSPKLVTVQEPLFSLSLPEDWQPRDNTDTPKPTYSWHGTTSKDNTRWMNIYVDDIPATMAVNRVLPVESNGTTLTLTTDVSDNCTTFTGLPSNDQKNSVLAKWQGISFLCDTGNYLRDVVGTSSTDGVNSVQLTSATTGIHKFFFTYTDNSASPDYSVFMDALKSFHLK